ncbi:alpha/beta hydrolase [Streptomyces sp. NPDC051658]|uniref:alpha/beta hydrolase n=1 Tax=Streptomyces sp. NPDC051658 TaxID=3365667 RepID=UPI0037B9CA2B
MPDRRAPVRQARPPSQRRLGPRQLLSNTDTLWGSYELFTPGMEEEQRRGPEVSPLFADLAGLPPARIVVGTEDPLLDDSLFLAQGWQAAGAPVQLGVVAGAMHEHSSHTDDCPRSACVLHRSGSQGMARIGRCRPDHGRSHGRVFVVPTRERVQGLHVRRGHPQP